MPNCATQGCKVHVVADGMYCRVHQHENKGELVEVKVTYHGEGMVQLPFGNFVKGTSAKVPQEVADELKGNKDWVIET